MAFWADGFWADGFWADGFWSDGSGGVTIGTYGDLNTRLLVYLRAYYSVTGGDLTTLSTRYMNGLTTGDRNQKMRQLIADATAAMT